MRKLFIPLLVSVFSLTGCEKLSLNAIESASSDLQECLVNQIVPGECNEERKDLDIAILEAKRDGIQEEKIEASASIGEKKVEGSPGNSLYSQISRSLMQSPYHIEPEYANYSPYKKHCPDIDDIDEVTEYFRDIGGYYKIVGYRIESGLAKFFLVVESKPCLPEGERSIDEKFPYITESQYQKLKNGEYIEDYYGAQYSKVEVKVFNTMEKAVEEYEKLQQ